MLEHIHGYSSYLCRVPGGLNHLPKTSNIFLSPVDTVQIVQILSNTIQGMELVARAWNITTHK